MYADCITKKSLEGALKRGAAINSMCQTTAELKFSAELLEVSASAA